MTMKYANKMNIYVYWPPVKVNNESKSISSTTTGVIVMEK